MTELNVCAKREKILSTDDHLLIEGGPGSGKTTIALLKAKQLIEDGRLKPYQKILFLSFARATVSRVEEQSKSIITKVHKKSIEINTYHGFAWSVIKSYGYLFGQHRAYQIITPPNLSARTADLTEEEKTSFPRQLFEREGIICFDLFAEITTSILKRSEKIRSIFAHAYPYIIVDEFQDTDEQEWQLVKLLGAKSKIVALADLDQRIYTFRGASVARIPTFNEHFKPVRIDFGTENNRSSLTDIVTFGDDMLKGANKGKSYRNVIVTKYPYYKDSRLPLKGALLASIKRIKKTGSADWSIAVLVKSKADTLTVSNYLSSVKIYHEVLIDPSGPSLSAGIIAKLLQPCRGESEDAQALLISLLNHLKGRKGDKISKADLALAQAMEKYILTGKIQGSTRISILAEINAIISKRAEMLFSGVPEEDWVLVRKLFQDCKQDMLRNVYEDARFIRLLNKGAVLSERLAEMWRLGQHYGGAQRAIEDALIQEHFSMSNRLFKGVFVMNIHKSKGKEFDEVIIWEELYKPFVRPESNEQRIEQDRLLFRVAATRARNFTTFMTPSSAPCILL
jgi:DNA helicase-2/ATP-dependent DNA helicase PcrA